MVGLSLFARNKTQLCKGNTKVVVNESITYPLTTACYKIQISLSIFEIFISGTPCIYHAKVYIVLYKQKLFR